MAEERTVRIASSGFELVKIDGLVPYARNAKKHGAKQIDQLRRSLREFGFVAPVLIDENRNVIAGHGRIEAAKAEGMTEVPCVYIEGLSEEQRRAYIIADNRLTELGEWDTETLQFEMRELAKMDFDTRLTGFELDEKSVGIFDEAQRAPDMDALATEGVETNDEYDAFVEKFKPKLTTDDCYTPPAVYEAVRRWAVERYALGDAEIVRPFYPGGDYRSFSYPDGCVVLDNPPFSILSEICKFYMEKRIRFFLFAPALTLFSTASGTCNYIATSATIIYENGATVRTAFVTSLGEYKIETAPDLYEAIDAANDERDRPDELPGYEYPGNVMTVSRASSMARYEKFAVKAGSCHFIRELDAQRGRGKSIYGAAFLLSEKAAAEKAAAEKAAAEKAAAEKAAAERRSRYRWELSDREKEIVRSLE